MSSQDIQPQREIPKWLWLTPVVFALVSLVYSAIVLTEVNLSHWLDNGLYGLLGIFAATFANLSGAGGGVVFIPVFAQLGFTEGQTLATSFGIQCFGMSAGAIAWSHYRISQARDNPLWMPFLAVITLTTIPSIIGIWSVYSGLLRSPMALHSIFSGFSIVLGLLIIVQVIATKGRAATRTKLDRIDVAALLLVGYFGGVITAWLSVGVGEILVLYLILRRFCTTMSVAAAVVVTAITVWSAALEHFSLNPQVVWQVALFAGPGAVIGGFLARQIAARISTRNLKLVLACWILIMGIVG